MKFANTNCAQLTRKSDNFLIIWAIFGAPMMTSLNVDGQGGHDLDVAVIKGSTSSVLALAHTSHNSSMAPLQGHSEAQSVICLNTIETNATSQRSSQQRRFCHQNSVPATGTTTSASSEYSSANSSTTESCPSVAAFVNAKSLRHSSSLNPLVATTSSVSARSSSVNSSNNSFTTAKNEHSLSTAAATAAAGAAAVTSSTDGKEKKRKEVSSSRVKKFHRHFTQVSKDEKLINYFSCALVSDILLQGHLYITDQHFAFYSNVFGYVTKVVIPTSSVTKISKEKTAKIIPNAVGVATADERHVFGSFISREAAFRLMCSVCPPLLPIEILPKITAADIEYSEDLSIEDDSSCSISGNESPSQPNDGSAAISSDGQTLLRRTVVGSSLPLTNSAAKATANSKHMRHSDIPNNAKSSSTSSGAAAERHVGIAGRASAPPTAHFNINSSNNMSSLAHSLGLPTSLLSTPTTGAAASAASNLTMIIAGTASSTSASSSPSPSSVSSTTSLPTTMLNTPKTAAKAAAAGFKVLSKNALLRLKFPTELHVVYLGVLLSVVLALFSGFLLYRILDIEAKTSLYRSPTVNWGSVNDDDIFAEALRWQKELQTKSTEEAQSILNTNLEQIAKVRRSLETLSMLIHDRSSAASTSFATNPADALNRDDSD